ncbi:MAG: 1-deoxy-D-xylulose-5-phosphate synthase [Mycoplasmatales bacterium]
MIENINEPQDLHKLSLKELDIYAKEVRELLISSISKTGGHLGSSLGATDLIIALHYNFNSPKDKLIFDVGHQAYAHKVICGRKDKIKNIRQSNGISGYLKKDESVHDVWEAGHSSTSISSAIGFALANKLNNSKDHVVCVIGDGSLTSGMSFEALNHLSTLDSKVIIIINDNEMSISNNVGFINSILNSLENNKEYRLTKTKVKDKLSKNKLGTNLSDLISVSKKRLKRGIQGDAKSFFSNIGFNYIGTVDGHNFEELNKAITSAKLSDRSVVLHVKTIKGKGYIPAEQGSWHGSSPFDIKTGKSLKTKEGMSYSKFISSLVLENMHTKKELFVITPAMLAGSELEEIQEVYPLRITDVGIAEEHAITLASSMGLTNIKPFVSIYSSFLQRGYDQVFHDAIRQESNIILGIDRAGIVGEDGSTHQGIYDISFLSHMPNMTIVQGSNASETKSLLNYAINYDKVIAIRYPRGGSFSKECLDLSLEKVEHGTWKYDKDIKDKVVISYGEILSRVNEAFKDNQEVSIINAWFIKPIDTTLLDLIKDKEVYVVEEVIRTGSLTSLITEYYNDNNILKNIKNITLREKIIKHGKREEILDQVGFSIQDIQDLIK